MEGSKDPLFLASIPSVQTYVEAPFLYSRSSARSVQLSPPVRFLPPDGPRPGACPVEGHIPFLPMGWTPTIGLCSFVGWTGRHPILAGAYPEGWGVGSCASPHSPGWFEDELHTPTSGQGLRATCHGLTTSQTRQAGPTQLRCGRRRRPNADGT
eukprot:scaffold1800_cov332-Pavlova_lutheri.AAC.6